MFPFNFKYFLKIVCCVVFLFLFILCPLFVSAIGPLETGARGGTTETYVPLAPIAGYIDKGVSTSLTAYLNGLFKLGVAVATGLAVIMITIGAIEYMSTDAVGSKEEGKAKITSALWGLLIALGAFILLNTINPQLLNTEPVIGTISISTRGLAADWRTIPAIPTPNATPYNSVPAGSPEAVNQMVEALRDRGITNPTAVAAILAQANAESGFNPLLISNEPDGSNGLFQVNNEVWRNYQAWAAQNGYSPDSHYAQTYYMLGNFQRVDSTSWNTFQTASTPTQALDAWRNWNFGGVNLPQRYSSADQYYQNYQQNQSWGH